MVWKMKCPFGLFSCFFVSFREPQYKFKQIRFQMVMQLWFVHVGFESMKTRIHGTGFIIIQPCDSQSMDWYIYIYGHSFDWYSNQCMINKQRQERHNTSSVTCVFQGPVVIPKQKSLPSQQVAKCKFRASLAGLKKQGTLPETNIAPENRPSQKEMSIPTMNFHVLF